MLSRLVQRAGVSDPSYSLRTILKRICSVARVELCTDDPAYKFASYLCPVF